MLRKGRAYELSLRFLLWGLIAFSYCGVKGKDLRGACQRQEAFPPAKFPALTFSPFSSLRLRGGAVRSCSSASPGSNRKLVVDNDEDDSTGGDAEANYSQSDGNSRGGLPEHFSDTARSGHPGGTKDVGRGRPSSDRQEEVRRKLQRFNQRYGIASGRFIDTTSGTTAAAGSVSRASKQLDAQAALLEAQKRKEKAEQELGVLTSELEQDALKRPSRRLEREEIDEIKRRCNRLKQIIGDVKRLEKNLALKKQFSARASSTTLTCSLRTHTLVVVVH